MEQPTPAAAGQPAIRPVARGSEVSYFQTRHGRLMAAYPRSCWDARLHQVNHLSDPSCRSDTLCTVDDFGDLVVTHRRAPQSLAGMAFVPVQQPA